MDQVRIQLSTKDSSIDLPEQTGPILVSAGLRRYALSTLVNTLRSTAGTSDQQPFSFLINGQFLTTSLAEYLTTNGVSPESVLELEYISATLPPKHQGSFVHDDWVGSVDVLSSSTPSSQATPNSIAPGNERIASASYDGLLRIWNMSGECTATSTRDYDHPKAIPTIRSVRWTSPTTLLSAGHDMRIRHWTYNTASETLTPSIDMYGHTSFVNSLSVHQKTSTALSASNDNTAMLWSFSKSSSQSPPANPTLLSQLSYTSQSAKRRKISTSSSSAPKLSIPTRGPQATLTGHTAPVHSAIFDTKDPSVAYTSSSDRSLRTWDLTTAREVSQRTPMPNVPLYSLSSLPSLNLLATGGTSNIALVDPRESAVTSANMICAGHRNGITSIAPSPQGLGRRFEFISTGQDGVVCVWDVRNLGGSSSGDDSAAVVESVGFGAGRRLAKPVWKIGRRDENGVESTNAETGMAWQVFDAVWDQNVGVVSAGQDCRVQIDKV